MGAVGTVGFGLLPRAGGIIASALSTTYTPGQLCSAQQTPLGPSQGAALASGSRGVMPNSWLTPFLGRQLPLLPQPCSLSCALGLTPHPHPHPVLRNCWAHAFLQVRLRLVVCGGWDPRWPQGPAGPLVCTPYMNPTLSGRGQSVNMRDMLPSMAKVKGFHRCS